MKHQLSFATITLLSDCIAEVVVNKDVEISLEMVEEYEAFFADKFSNAFGLLVNKIHYYNFSFEAKLSIGSHANLKAIAVINYNEKSELVTKDIAAIRVIDGWNLKSFSGLELGWQQGLDWLKEELSATS
mgnify:CR=1 FL=1